MCYGGTYFCIYLVVTANARARIEFLLQFVHKMHTTHIHCICIITYIHVCTARQERENAPSLFVRFSLFARSARLCSAQYAVQSIHSRLPLFPPLPFTFTRSSASGSTDQCVGCQFLFLRFIHPAFRCVLDRRFQQRSVFSSSSAQSFHPLCPFRKQAIQFLLHASSVVYYNS